MPSKTGYLRVKQCDAARSIPHSAYCRRPPAGTNRDLIVAVEIVSSKKCRTMRAARLSRCSATVRHGTVQSVVLDAAWGTSRRFATALPAHGNHQSLR